MCCLATDPCALVDATSSSAANGSSSGYAGCGGLVVDFEGHADLLKDQDQKTYGYINTTVKHAGGWSPFCGALGELFRAPPFEGVLEWGRLNANDPPFASMRAEVVFSNESIPVPGLTGVYFVKAPVVNRHTLEKDSLRTANGPAISIYVGVGAPNWVNMDAAREAAGEATPPPPPPASPPEEAGKLLERDLTLGAVFTGQRCRQPVTSRHRARPPAVGLSCTCPLPGCCL